MKIFGGNFFDARKERKVGGNFLRFRKGEGLEEILTCPQERVLTEYFRCPQERVLVGVVVLDVGFVVVVGVHVGECSRR